MLIGDRKCNASAMNTTRNLQVVKSHKEGELNIFQQFYISYVSVFLSFFLFSLPLYFLLCYFLLSFFYFPIFICFIHGNMPRPFHKIDNDIVYQALCCICSVMGWATRDFEYFQSQ